MPLFDQIAELPLQIDRYELEGLTKDVSSEFTRDTTVVHLSGAGHEGVGEDVTYHGLDHIAFQDEEKSLPISGSFTIRHFADLLDDMDLFPIEPVWEPSRHFRRWAFESAALDLALRQAGLPLHKAIGVDPAPVEFVISRRLGDPPSIDQIDKLLKNHPQTKFKLDPTDSWNENLIEKLVSTDSVVTVDFKGTYKGTIVDQDANPQLYKAVIDAFPHVWIEDPELNKETELILEEHHERITWDGPIHSVSDIVDLPFAPKTLNIKPSRFGSLEKLFAAYEYCQDNTIEMYGGGQFELGPGREQIQYLASLFHPSSPNDVAPAGYNDQKPASNLPASPLEPTPSSTGFRWGNNQTNGD